MKRLYLFFGMVVALGAVAVGGVLVGSGGPANASVRSDRLTTVRFRAHEVVKPRFLDSAPPKGPSSGDEVIEKETPLLPRQADRL